ncbi:uncharacterized protein LOC100183045 isoform X1 [Ciona intestinalis]
MKIVELYQRPSSKPLPVRIQIQHYALNGGVGRQDRKVSLDSIPEIKLQPHTTGARKRSHRNKMKIEQVNRHEETSYMLDEETNRAILQSIVAKDEISKYLSPLRFMEINTWRKEVPYGLNHESDNDRRKWRTPLEILCSVTGQASLTRSPSPPGGRSSAKPNEDKTKTKASAPVTRDTSAHVRNERSNIFTQYTSVGNNYLDGSIVGAKPQTKSRQGRLGYLETGHKYVTRPMTSPERHPILTKINSERLVATRQTSDPLPNGIGNQHSSNRPYTRDVATPNIYNRTPVTSPSNIKHSSQPSWQTNSKQFGRSVDSGQMSARPRIRSGSELHRPRSGFESRIGGNSERSVPPINPHPPGLRRHNSDITQSDPNIAYVPISPKRAPHYRRDPINTKVKNYYAARIAANDVIMTSPTHSTPPPHIPVPENSKKKLKYYNTTYRPSSQPGKFSNGITPRIVYANDVIARADAEAKMTSSVITSHHSPWVTQALPHLSGATEHNMSSAERDGYYVSRKPSKTVSFRLENGESSPRIAKNQNSNDNVSMVVVNMDGQYNQLPSNRGNSLAALNRPVMSPRSSLNIRESSTGFTQTGSVPTITVRQ